MPDKKPEIRFKITDALNQRLNNYCDEQGLDRIDIVRCAFFEKCVELGVIRKIPPA